MTSTRILLLPGWPDAGADHWQTRWEQRHGFERVLQDEGWWPRRGDWMIRLEETLLAGDGPAVLVAHGLGCHLVAAWAAHSQLTARVRAALLVAPPDLERPDMPPQVQAWAPMQRQPLPFASTAVLPFASTAVLGADDPSLAADRGLALATDWGSEVVTLAPVGPVDAASGLGDWPEGLGLLHALMRRAGLA